MKTKCLQTAFVGLALLAFGLCARADTVTAWKKFTDPDGRYSILMPGDPQHQASAAPASDGKPASQTDLYIAGENGNIYMTGATNYDPAAKIDVEGELAADRDNFNQGISAQTTSQQRIKFAGFPALKFNSSSATANFSALVVLDGNHCFMVVAVYHTADEPADVGRFSQSFKLISP